MAKLKTTAEKMATRGQLQAYAQAYHDLKHACNEYFVGLTRLAVEYEEKRKQMDADFKRRCDEVDARLSSNGFIEIYTPPVVTFLLDGTPEVALPQKITLKKKYADECIEEG